jgi:hypothetical protein
MSEPGNATVAGTDKPDLTDFPDPRAVPTMSVTEAGRWIGIGPYAAYQAARNGSLPTIKVGKRLLRVPTAALAAMLGLDRSDPA